MQEVICCLLSGCLRRPFKYLRKEEKQKARGKGKIYLTECRVPENSKRDKRAFLNEKSKEVKENNRTEKTRDVQ